MNPLMQTCCLSLFGVALALVGCSSSSGGPNADASDSDTSQDVDSDGQQSAVDTSFQRAGWGVGAEWYDYSPATHVLTPRDVTWSLTSAASETPEHELSVATYYGGDAGQSGYFVLDVDGEELSTGASVKEGHVCVDLSAGAVVACDSPEATLTLRTDARPIPAAGFAATNPAIYVSRGAFPSVVEVDGNGNGAPLDSVRAELAEPALSQLVGNAEELHALQITADFRAAQWRVDFPEALDGDVTVEARCVPVGVSAERTDRLDSVSAVSLAFAAPATGWALVDLCAADGPANAGTLTTSELDRALWPENKSFDLMFGVVDGELRVLPSPEAAVRVVSAAWESDAAVIVPDEIWDDEF